MPVPELAPSTALTPPENALYALGAPLQDESETEPRNDARSDPVRLCNASTSSASDSSTSTRAQTRRRNSRTRAMQASSWLLWFGRRRELRLALGGCRYRYAQRFEPGVFYASLSLT